MSIRSGCVVTGGGSSNLDDVETFIVIGNFKEIPVVSVSLPLVLITEDFIE
jgi:hypothetical protein